MLIWKAFWKIVFVENATNKLKKINKLRLLQKL